MINCEELFASGRLFAGCNYWASHAGTNMWHDWNAGIVEADLARLAKAKIRVLRMFPLWSDFQPLRMHYTGSSAEKELRLGEEPLPLTEEGRAGIDPVMADRLAAFFDLAEKYQIRLVVGLITGWMSGRMYMPEAFAGRGLLTDPMVISWQIRYVRYLVRRFKNHPAIAAWDLGNECNCMEDVTRDQANLWVNVITDAIRAEDAKHPIVSGMHSLTPTGNFTPMDQGECLDVLCTHPYPIFTPHCDTDPIREMKSVLHSTAETVLYENLSGKTAFIEEAGTLGPMIASEENVADYVRCAMFSALAHDLRGFVWWCANEQSELSHTPYDWCAVERELGLFRIDGTPKPVLNTMTAFTEYVDRLRGEIGTDTLPRRLTDAVCILTDEQDSWSVAYGSFILAKQAGIDLTFAWHRGTIPEAKTYFLPALKGNLSIDRHVMADLLSRVESGATLYLSLDDALLSPFSSFTGVRVLHRFRPTAPDQVTFAGYDYTMKAEVKPVFESVGAEVLATDKDRNPVFTKMAYGKGTVVFLAYPIERYAAEIPGVVSGEGAVPYYRFYEKIGARCNEKVAILDKTTGIQTVAVTEHPESDAVRYLVVINYRPEAADTALTLSTGFRLSRVSAPFGGCAEEERGRVRLSLPGNTGLILRIEK